MIEIVTIYKDDVVSTNVSPKDIDPEFNIDEFIKSELTRLQNPGSGILMVFSVPEDNVIDSMESLEAIREATIAAGVETLVIPESLKITIFKRPTDS